MTLYDTLSMQDELRFAFLTILIPKLYVHTGFFEITGFVESGMWSKCRVVSSTVETIFFFPRCSNRYHSLTFAACIGWYNPQ
jgi:hypothetical protein